MRYYTRERTYRAKGPPPPALRIIAPLVVLSTIAVFVTGIVLLALGPGHRDPWLLLHKVSFIAWIAVTALHVLGHLPGRGTSFRGAATLRNDIGIPGTGSRWLAVSGAVAAGLVLAVVLIPEFSSWTAHGVIGHHHHPR
jgi:hypothetical protein